MRFATACLIALSCLSCRPGRELAGDSEPSSFIGFVSLRISGKAADRPKLQLLRSEFVPGRLKPGFQASRSQANYLTLFLYSRKRIVDSIILAHPLFPRLETTDASGRLYTESARLDSADFFIRFGVNVPVDGIQAVDHQFATEPVRLPFLKLR